MKRQVHILEAVIAEQGGGDIVKYAFVLECLKVFFLYYQQNTFRDIN